MADGGRARSKTTAEDWAQLERAARRIAGACGYGSPWKPSVLLHDPAEPELSAERYSVAHRGRVLEQAAWAVTGTEIHVRRQHSLTIHQGVVAVPYASPDAVAMAAVSYARLSGPEWPLLLTYACESFGQWCRVEPYLWRVRPSPHQVIAGRDAMARIMYRRACLSIDERAKVLGVRAGDYRLETRNAQEVLERWLVRAARRLNRCADWRPPPIGASHGNAHSVETWWHPERPLNRDGFTPSRRHKK